MASLALAAAACFLVILLLRRLFSSKQPLPLPPGPRGLPLIGNLLDMPSKEQWLTFAQWGATWGDITFVKVLGRPIIVLNSAKATFDLLDKRSNIYSDRPVLQMAGKLIGYDNMLGIIPYGDRFRSHRRLFQRSVGTRTLVAQFLPIEEEETHRMLRRTLSMPTRLPDHIAQMAGAVILRISHGYEPEGEGDYFVQLGRDMMAQFSQAVAPGTFLVDVLPILRYLPEWMPGAQFKKTAKDWSGTLQNLLNQPHEYVKQQLKSGTARISFTANLLEGKELSELDEEDIKWSAAAMFAGKLVSHAETLGGSDTTAAVLEGFYLAMALYPEIQKKAQAELDAVVGNDRLPSFEDRPQLPYLEALMMEVLRWHSAAPTAIPHLVVEDDIYNGFFIPKGTSVIANVWGMLHDPRTYPDPMKFDPERYIASKDSEPQRDPRELCFGFGRRACPGRILAEASVFICCAMSLAVFNVSKHVKDGVVVEPEIKPQSGVVSYPAPYKYVVTPRSEKAVALIRAP